MSLRARFESAVWTSPERFSLGGAEFGLLDLSGRPPPPQALALFKGRDEVEAYIEVLDGTPIRNMLELGIFLGGSAALLTILFEPERLSCIDISGPVEALEEFRAHHPLGGRIRAHYAASQHDEARLAAICEEDFDGPLDLVIDDASHLYAPSRASFEILFPRLKPRAWYVIEDWQWAHEPGFRLWPDQPALSNLVFELLMTCAGRPDLVAKVVVNQGMAFVQKGDAPASDTRLDLGKLYTTHGRQFVPI